LKSLHKKGVTDPTAHGHGNESLALSLLTCFSGGVFLATCLLHLIPEVREHVERFERSYGFKFSYPTEQMLICSGFFLMYFMEKTISRYLLSAAHNHSCEE
jgi:zinc transporter 1/2/3